MNQNRSADKSGLGKSPGNFSADQFADMKNELSKGKNLADLISKLNNDSQNLNQKLPSLIQSLLVDSFQYSFLSFNLPDIAPNLKLALGKLKNLSHFDVVLALFKSRIEVELINPANSDHLNIPESVFSRKLIVAYAKSKKTPDKESESQFLIDLKDALLSKSDTRPSTASTEGPTEVSELNRSPRKQNVKITLQYGIPVTNELFHYGNVEAWNNIIESYKSAYPGTEVLLFHRGRRVYRIYSLFGWGKIKFGDAIFFAVAGKNFKDVAKLKKYLSEAAGPRFQPYIKKNINFLLKLF